MKRIILGVVLCAFAAPALAAGPIHSACLKHGRKGPSANLCNCLQQTADLKLTKRQQRKVSKFFKDPDLAQETRQSDRRSDEVLWKRYKEWGKFASKVCAS